MKHNQYTPAGGSLILNRQTVNINAKIVQWSGHTQSHATPNPFDSENHTDVPIYNAKWCSDAHTSSLH